MSAWVNVCVPLLTIALRKSSPLERAVSFPYPSPSPFSCDLRALKQRLQQSSIERYKCGNLELSWRFGAVQIRIWSFWDLNNGVHGVLYALGTATTFQVFIKVSTSRATLHKNPR